MACQYYEIPESRIAGTRSPVPTKQSIEHFAKELSKASCCDSHFYETAPLHV